jgi:hypothetical protein
MTSILLIFAALFGVQSVWSSVAASVPEASSSSVSFIVTTTSNYPATMAGNSLQVTFDSIQLTTPLPQAYSFGIVAKTAPGQWITQLVWLFGDGAALSVPYCCQSQISEVRYHAYAQQGSYTVQVVAFDNIGNTANAVVTVNWTVHAPEYPAATLPMIASLFLALVAVSFWKGHSSRLVLGR